MMKNENDMQARPKNPNASVLTAISHAKRS